MKFIDDRTDFAVGQNHRVRRQSQFSIQDRMMIKNARLRSIVSIWPAIASGMRQLQPDEESFLRARGPLMFFNQDFSQSRQSPLGMPRHHQLIRIRAPLVRDRDRLTSPDQFSPASSDLFPPVDGM